jgi:uncharacterized membrane protein
MMLTALSLLCGINACDADERGLVVAGAAGDDDAPGAAGTGSELMIESDWCAARQVLATKCQRCHAAPPEHGAPFPLVAYDDTQVLSARGEARFVAIEAAVSKDFMPPSFITLEPPVDGLVEHERDVLLSWCRAGGPPAARGQCDGEP